LTINDWGELLIVIILDIFQSQVLLHGTWSLGHLDDLVSDILKFANLDSHALEIRSDSLNWTLKELEAILQE
jgi:hypothetical protein